MLLSPRVGEAPQGTHCQADTELWEAIMTDNNPFAFTPPALSVPTPTSTVMAEQWTELGRPGTWWTGEQRVAIASTARANRRGLTIPETETINDTTRRAAALVATKPWAIDQATVSDLNDSGLGLLAYVELVGIIARATAIDTASIGLGADLAPLPHPEPGPPSHATVPGSKQRAAWVPMVGGAGATTALSAIAAEDKAQEELHGALYLSYSEMGDMAITKGLTRPQMELVATRTSIHNDCYF